MQRTIIEPADVSGAALAELKSWLGISRSNEDDLLVSLLLASLDMCEAFTGQAPLSQLAEERLPVQRGRYSLSSQPVNSLVVAEVLTEDGTLTALDSSLFEIELGASGKASFQLLQDADGRAVILNLRVGLAASWDVIPAALKQGLIRLAAFHYRDRDRTGGTKDEAVPPASISALWRPWRQMRLQ